LQSSDLNVVDWLVAEFEESIQSPVPHAIALLSDVDEEIRKAGFFFLV
jgi:hypothetical protein